MSFNKIGIIGGTGWLGHAIAQNILANNYISPDNFWIANRTGKKEGLEQWPNVHFTTNPQELIDNCELVILSVLPQQFVHLQINASQKIVMSVMAGVSIAKIKQLTQASLIIRTMPNAAAEIGLSYTPWFTGSQIDNTFYNDIQALLSTFGIADQVQSEDAINYFTALTGSGHGIVAYFQHAMIAAAVKKGIAKAIAERAIKQLFLGAGSLIASAKQTPAETVQALIDYAGTTAAALNSFDDAELTNKINQSIQAAYEKAKSDMSSNK